MERERDMTPEVILRTPPALSFLVELFLQRLLADPVPANTTFELNCQRSGLVFSVSPRFYLLGKLCCAVIDFGPKLFCSMESA